MGNDFTILRPEQYVLIYRLSYVSFFVALYALYRQQYALVIVPSSVFIGSRLYWYKPDYSWRRNLDMVIAYTMVVYQYGMAYNSDMAVPYYIVTTTGLCCYQVGVYYYSLGDTWSSVYYHAMLHILANMGNVILYSGVQVQLQLPKTTPLLK